MFEGLIGPVFWVESWGELLVYFGEVYCSSLETNPSKKLFFEKGPAFLHEEPVHFFIWFRHGEIHDLDL